MVINPKSKRKRGKLEFVPVFKEHGYEARRGQ